MNADSRALLTPYVTNLDRPVFVLRNLPEEVVAVLFAYYSRSRDDLRSNLLKLIQDRDLDMAGAVLPADEDEAALAQAKEKARQFHEKWVVGYGHASVAEHAVAHVAVEDVSILVSKAIEDHRLASYTEKSTRFVVFERGRCYRPAEEELSPALREEYDAAVDRLFATYEDTYEKLMPQVVARLEAEADPSMFQSETGFRAACRAQACDLLRYLLPAATRTNVGLTANARALEHMVTKLLSHPLAEARAVGAAIQREAQQVIPTLIKYAARNDYREQTPQAIAGLARKLLPQAPSLTARGQEFRSQCTSGGPVRLVEYPADAEERLAAAILYEQSALPWERVREWVAALPQGERERVIDEYLKRRGKWDAPLRCLEHLSYTYEILVDFGAYRDIQRHRMCTQTDQPLTVAHGFEMPTRLAEYGFAAPFETAMERAAAAYRKLAEQDPHVAQYVVPLAFRKRLLITWNLREIHHFVTLRSQRQGHFSYRRIAHEVWHELGRVHPFLARFIEPDTKDYELARSG
ncbi:MAG: FAD-dependent thymidylate synthase [Armatimonadetes bacterium]|nr:FAD-dependent thymidylate synthase [Armatimonadota bacterium]